MCDIDVIISMLSWNCSVAEQAKGLALAKSVDCIKSFFQPTCSRYDKDVWENCAVIICERADEELMPYISDMVLWLQDMNWPGADRIKQRLLSFTDNTILAKLLNRFTVALCALDEESWLMSLADLLNNPDLFNKVDLNTRMLLQTYK